MTNFRIFCIGALTLQTAVWLIAKLNGDDAGRGFEFVWLLWGQGGIFAVAFFGRPPIKDSRP